MLAINNTNMMSTVSFAYARRRDSRVEDPTARYQLIGGRYRPLNDIHRYYPGDKVRVLADKCVFFSSHDYAIGRILTVSQELKHPPHKLPDNPYRYYYRFVEGYGCVVPMDELELVL